MASRRRCTPARPHRRVEPFDHGLELLCPVLRAPVVPQTGTQSDGLVDAAHVSTDSLAHWRPHRFDLLGPPPSVSECADNFSTATVNCRSMPLIQFRHLFNGFQAGPSSTHRGGRASTPPGTTMNRRPRSRGTREAPSAAFQLGQRPPGVLDIPANDYASRSRGAPASRTGGVPSRFRESSPKRLVAARSANQ